MLKNKMWIIIALMASFILAFSLQNGQAVTVKFLWIQTSLPLATLMLTAAFIGAILAGIGTYTALLELRERYKGDVKQAKDELAKALKQLEIRNEIDKLKQNSGS